MMRLRARDYGIIIGQMKPGPLNSITDVKGVGVGHSTLIQDDSIRTGVTAITPHNGNLYESKVKGAVDILNAYGKSVGLEQIIFEGWIETPIMLTETLNTYRVADAVIDYYKENFETPPRSLNCIVGETNGGFLTDNLNRHIGIQQVFEAIDKARSPMEGRKVEEGSHGGGTPMTGYGFKGGIGTSSRIIEGCTVGVLVQLNCGRKNDLLIDGVPVGRETSLPEEPRKSIGNSIMMIVATNLDVNTRQLWKIAKRTSLGLARTGSFSSNNSGDYSIAFTTSKLQIDKYIEQTNQPDPKKGDSFLNPLYKATVEATEEAIINALFKAETMKGRDGNLRYALPLDQVQDIFEKFGKPL